MTPGEFNSQIDRLKDRFRDSAYPDSLVRLFWREVQDFSGDWFRRTIDKFIGEFRYPPLVLELREEISKERERIYHLDKREHAQDAKDFFSGSYQSEEKRIICQTIIARMRGQVNDEDYAKFVKNLEQVAHESERNRVRQEAGLKRARMN